MPFLGSIHNSNDPFFPGGVPRSDGDPAKFLCADGTFKTAGGGSTPRLDQVLNPTADKTFSLGAHLLSFDGAVSVGTLLTAGQFFASQNTLGLNAAFFL